MGIDSPLIALKRPTCNGCLKNFPHNIKLLKCATCKAAYYCDQNCQKRHWERAHKDECTADNIMIKFDIPKKVAKRYNTMTCQLLELLIMNMRSSDPIGNMVKIFTDIRTRIRTRPESIRMLEQWISKLGGSED